MNYKRIIFLLCSFSLCLSAYCKNNSKVDIDFTVFNYNIASAQIFNMIVDTDSYLGKTVRIKGKFYSSFNEDMNMRSYSVILWDATACCQTGLQFILKEQGTYPDDYPALMSDIEITGRLCCKNINGIDYLYIESDRIEEL